MARPKIASRRGRVGVYWRDALGKRHFVVAQDEAARDRLLAQIRGATNPKSQTVSEYARTWLERVRLRSSESTHWSYRQIVSDYVEGTEIGRSLLIGLRRDQVKAWIVAQLGRGVALNSIKFRVAVLRGLLGEAYEDGLLSSNPAAAVLRALRIRVRAAAVPPITAQTLAAILDHARDSQGYRGLALLAHSGLRVGEACGLPWSNVDLDAAEIRIEQQLARGGKIKSLKTERARRIVQLSRSFADEELRAWKREQQEAALASGEKPPALVLAMPGVAPRYVRDRLRRALWAASKALGLPRLKLHHIRHAWASIHLSRGRSLSWVQEQMGHTDPRITEGYGSHLRRRDQDAADDMGMLLKPRQISMFAKK